MSAAASTFIPHSRPLPGPEEEEAAARVVRSGRLAQGPEVEALEEEPARLFPHAEKAWRTTLSLPLYPALRDEEAERVTQAVREACLR